MFGRNVLVTSRGVSIPQYSGNITEWEWSRIGDTYTNRYSFHYDPLDRLTSSTLYRNASIYDRYSEKNIGYDLGGNIRQITRRNGTATETLLMQYSGNRLMATSRNGQFPRLTPTTATAARLSTEITDCQWSTTTWTL